MLPKLHESISYMKKNKEEYQTLNANLNIVFVHIYFNITRPI